MMGLSRIGSYLFLISCILLSFGWTYGNPQEYTRSRGFSFPENNANQLSHSYPSYQSQQLSVVQGVGGTGISCDSPGKFVTAPDGCNRCFCEQNGELSAACSRALCPPGFPSGNKNRFRF